MVGRNLHRRHLTPSQRAAIAVPIKEKLQEEYDKRRIANLLQSTKRGGKGKRKEPGKGVATIGNSIEEQNSRAEAAALMKVSHGYSR